MPRLLLRNLNELQDSPIGITKIAKFHTAQERMFRRKGRRLGGEANTLLIEVTINLLYITHQKSQVRGAERGGWKSPQFAFRQVRCIE